MTYPVLGIDPSTFTGYALLWETGVVLASEINFKKLSGIPRAEAFMDHTMRLVEHHKPCAVFIEGYGFGNAHTLAILVEIGTAIRLALHGCGMTYTEVAPTSLKKFATGKGNSQKDQVMLAVYKKWGFTPETNNIADAYVLAKMAANAEGWADPE